MIDWGGSTELRQQDRGVKQVEKHGRHFVI